MRLKILTASLIPLLVATIWLICISPHKLQQVNEFRRIKVKDYCPAFACIQDDLRKITPSEPAKFVVLFVSEELSDPDSWNLDDRKTCGKITDMIVKKGGHFFPCADGKFAGLFGIDSVLSRAGSPFAWIRDAVEKVLWDNNLIAERSNQWKLDASLIAVTDGKGKILALYKNAKLGDIERIVKDLQL